LHSHEVDLGGSEKTGRFKEYHEHVKRSIIKNKMKVKRRSGGVFMVSSYRDQKRKGKSSKIWEVQRVLLCQLAKKNLVDVLRVASAYRMFVFY
jgi:hypothetical protein